MHPPPKRVFVTRSEKAVVASLPDQIDQLLSDQKRAWKRLAEGYSAFQKAKTREVDCRSFSVTLQFNPQRIVSTDARTDEQSILSRKCFLCMENLPAEQQGILYKDTYLILCNPAPIFSRHLTISHVNHRKQAIDGFTGDLLDFAYDLSPSHTVFYNGPQSGASAPDHMHFQALPTNVLPVEYEANSSARRLLRLKEKSVTLWTLNDYGRQVILLESNNKVELEEILYRLLNAMKNVLGIVDEPLVNILCVYAQEHWRMFVFPRSKHRPEEFFKQGAERIVISPAAVDMGGFIVTPLQKDFETVDAGIVERIFRQVSQDSTTVGRILNAL